MVCRQVGCKGHIQSVFVCVYRVVVVVQREGRRGQKGEKFRDLIPRARKEIIHLIESPGKTQTASRPIRDSFFELPFKKKRTDHRITERIYTDRLKLTAPISHRKVGDSVHLTRVLQIKSLPSLQKLTKPINNRILRNKTDHRIISQIKVKPKRVGEATTIM